MPDDGAGEPAGGDARALGRRRTFVEQARRAQIVEAAIATIAEVGYGKATFARIAARAGISPALISYHFAGKGELMAEVVAHVNTALDHVIAEATAGAESYQDVLRRWIETQVRYFGDHVTEMRALGQVFAHARDHGEDLGGDSRRAALDEIEEMFREGQADGELRRFDPRPMAVTLYAALEAVPPELAAHPGTDAAAYGRELADLFVAATRAR